MLINWGPSGQVWRGEGSKDSDCSLSLPGTGGGGLTGFLEELESELVDPMEDAIEVDAEDSRAETMEFRMDSREIFGW